MTGGTLIDYMYFKETKTAKERLEIAKKWLKSQNVQDHE